MEQEFAHPQHPGHSTAIKTSLTKRSFGFNLFHHLDRTHKRNIRMCCMIVPSITTFCSYMEFTSSYSTTMRNLVTHTHTWH